MNGEGLFMLQGYFFPLNSVEKGPGVEGKKKSLQFSIFRCKKRNFWPILTEKS